VKAGGREIALTPREYRVLAAFVRHAGQLLTPDQLLELARGSEAPGREQVKIGMAGLRRKLAAAGVGDAAIETIRGFGYRYRRPA
jgi:DNA-binding response OmpR family regulator